MASRRMLYMNGRKHGVHTANFEDQIKGALDTQVTTYSLQSFERFAVFHGQIGIIPTDNSKPYCEERHQPVGFTEYFIEATGRPPQEVKIRIANMQIQLLHDGEWTDILTVLERIPAPTSWQSSNERMTAVQKQALWDRQFQWYNDNTKTFPFLNLPSEIREKIYFHLFPTTFQPYPYCLSQRRPWKTSVGIAQDQGNAALLLASKQLHNEAGHILFRDTTFLVERTSIMNRAICHTPALSRHLKRLEMSFGHEQYLRVFGFYFNPDAMYDTKPAAHALRDLDLTLLTLRVGAPVSAYSGGAWVPSCQKKAAKYILRAAYPWAKGHPVKVVGCILEKQKGIFESKMGEKREEYLVWREIGEGTLREWDEDEGGVRINQRGEDDGEGEGGGEVRKEIEWPPTCRCRVHCGRIKWGSE